MEMAICFLASRLSTKEMLPRQERKFQLGIGFPELEYLSKSELEWKTNQTHSRHPPTRVQIRPVRVDVRDVRGNHRAVPSGHHTRSRAAGFRLTMTTMMAMSLRTQLSPDDTRAVLGVAKTPMDPVLSPREPLIDGRSHGPFRPVAPGRVRSQSDRIVRWRGRQVGAARSATQSAAESRITVMRDVRQNGSGRRTRSHDRSTSEQFFFSVVSSRHFDKNHRTCPNKSSH